MNIVIPSAAIVPNTPPANGNTMPTTGLHAITNVSEAMMWCAYVMENALGSDKINFGNTVLPTIEINEVKTATGIKFSHVSVFIEMKPDYATFPLGKNLWKQVNDRLPTNPAALGFNQG